MSLLRFGDPWDAPICEDAPECPTPVGQPCIHCGEKVAAGDQGLMMPCVRMGEDGEPAAAMEPTHRECHMRMVLGGVAHLERRCSPLCYGDGSADTEPGKSIREEGREVLAWLESHGGARF
jgi:hypothetical protein